MIIHNKGRNVMFKWKKAFFVTTLLSGSLLALFVNGFSSPDDEKTDELKAAFELTVELYNAGNIDEYFANIHDDVVYYTFSRNAPLEGKTEVRRWYETMLAEVDSVYWESLGPKFLVNGTTGIVWSPFIHTVKWKDKSIQTFRGQDTEIFTKVDGKWFKIFEHMSRFPKD